MYDCVLPYRRRLPARLLYNDFGYVRGQMPKNANVLCEGSLSKSLLTSSIIMSYDFREKLRHDQERRQFKLV